MKGYAYLIQYIKEQGIYHELNLSVTNQILNVINRILCA